MVGILLEIKKKLFIQISLLKRNLFDEHKCCIQLKTEI